MARRQNHVLEVFGIPCREDQSAVVRVGLELVNDFGKLINTLTCIIRLRIHILSAKVSPLEAVDGPKIADLSMRET